MAVAIGPPADLHF